jgi:hypothetical protein
MHGASLTRVPPSVPPTSMEGPKADPLGRKVPAGALDAAASSKAARRNARRAAKRAGALLGGGGRGGGRAGGGGFSGAQDYSDEDEGDDNTDDDSGGYGTPPVAQRAGAWAAGRAGGNAGKQPRSPPSGLGPTVHGNSTQLMDDDPRLGHHDDDDGRAARCGDQQRQGDLCACLAVY